MANIPMPEGVTDVDLECVMLDLPPIPVREYLGHDFQEKFFFYGDTPELRYAQGPVAEETAHVTLLYGIHPSDTYTEDVYAVLDGWVPEEIFVRKVSFFPSSVEGQDYKCIVLEVAPTANLLNANKRLTALPYTNKFTEYRPHVTLAYVRGDLEINIWLNRLNAHFVNRVLYPTKLNLGLDD